jgi:DNA-binding GntR family transcriptional regulator
MSAPAARRGGEGANLREQAYEGFTRSLLARELRPGQFITQRELVEITGFPLGAIRELVPRLEAEGLIRTAPQRGMQVPQVDIELVRCAFQFRAVLEEAAMRLFVREVSEGVLAGMRRAHERILARHAAGADADARLMEDAERTDLSLHETIVDGMRNGIIANAYRVNWIKIRLIRLAETRLYVPMIPAVMGEHMRIIEAVERRDEAGAVTALSDHIETARRRALGI